MICSAAKLALTTALVAAVLPAATVSLKDDFSLANGNPNGNWSYMQGSTPGTGTLLGLQMPTLNGNATIPAVSTGFWGQGPDLNTNTPEIFKSLVNGSSAGGNDLDYLAGDIVAHSPNAGDYLFATWTAPVAGTINSYSGSVWYAHSSVTRSNNWALFFNTAGLASGSVTTGEDRNHADTFSGGPISVSAGDMLTLGIIRSSSPFGSLAGMSLNFDFTAAPTGAPEPGTWMALAGGLAVLAARRRSGKNAA